ncbi:MAG: iron chaperone [Anaerolineae bacterium]
MKPQEGKSSKEFTPEERAAMKEHAQELRGEASGKKGKVEGESAVLAKIAEMPEPDRAMAQRLHELIRTVVPSLEPRIWYGMPAYAKGGKVLCFFQSAQKFKTRYATLGFTDTASLDDDAMWPTSFALREWNPDVEARVHELLEKAVRG